MTGNLLLVILGIYLSVELVGIFNVFECEWSWTIPGLAQLGDPSGTNQA